MTPVANDPTSINGVAIAEVASSISEIEDASTYDFTSRTRRPREDREQRTRTCGLIGPLPLLRTLLGASSGVQC
jgi:hypothetical protein